MGRENKDPAVVGSSIVLLQERFKQLQRMKEMREERRQQQLNLKHNLPPPPPLPPQSSTDINCDQVYEVSSTSKSQSSSWLMEAAVCHDHGEQDPLALGLNSNTNSCFRAMIRPQVHYFPDSSARQPYNFYEKHHDAVDTSLRL